MNDPQAHDRSQVAQLTIDQCRDAIFWHRGLQIVYVNEQACRSLGYTRDELESMTLDQIDDGLPADEKRAIMERILREGSAVFETINIRRDGSRFPVELSVTAHEIEGEILFCGIARDISARTAIDEKLFASQRALQHKIHELELAERRSILALEGGRLGTFEWIPSQDEGHASHTFYGLFGQKPGDVPPTYRSFVAQAHPDDLPRIERIFGIGRLRRRPIALETRIIWPDGSVHWIEIRARFAYSPDGDPIRLDGVMVDIDEKKSAEKRLDARQHELQLALDASQMGTWEWDAVDNRIVYSAQTNRILGYGVTAGVSHVEWFIRHIHPDDYFMIRRSIARVRKSREYHHLEHRIIDATGSTRWIEIRGQFVYDSTGKVTHMRGVVADVTQRKQAEEELQLRRFAVDVAAEAMFTIDMEGFIVDANLVACDRLGYSRDELIGMKIKEISATETDDDFQQSVAQTRQQGGRTHIGRHRHRNGGILDVEITARVFDYKGQEYVCASARDITELKVAEQRLRDLDQQLAHMNRISSMGEMASTIAHELNQPLAVIANNASLLEIGDAAADIPDFRELTQTISSQAVLAGGIVRRMRGFCLNKTPTPSEVDLSEVIEESLRLLEPRLRHAAVDVSTRLVPGSRVLIDRIQIQQVLVNLIQNGIDAMKAVAEDTRQLSVSVQPRERFIRISVTDTGGGIAPENAKRLFEPFHSTKASGMGMGLPISRSIVEAHHGRLRFDNTVSGGARFSIDLPALTTDSHRRSEGGRRDGSDAPGRSDATDNSDATAT